MSHALPLPASFSSALYNDFRGKVDHDLMHQAMLLAVVVGATERIPSIAVNYEPMASHDEQWSIVITVWVGARGVLYDFYAHGFNGARAKLRNYVARSIRDASDA